MKKSRNIVLVLVIAAIAVSFCGCRKPFALSGFSMSGFGSSADSGSEDDEGSADKSIEDDIADSSSDDVSASEMSYKSERTTPAEFVKKIDGDTAWFLINEDGNDFEIKVRFLGIDTPETIKEGVEVQEWGPEASAYTENALANASEITLEFDDGSDTIDKYGRYLAWVWVDGSLLNEELVKNGFAKVTYIYGDYLYTDELLTAEESAQERGVGLW